MTRTMLGASLKMVLRDPQGIFWALAFPVIILGVFRLFSFGSAGTTDVVVAADDRAPAGAALVAGCAQISFDLGFTPVPLMAHRVRGGAG